MRFPRLSHLFHRRAKSDPEIHRLASASIAIPEARAISITDFQASSSAEIFTAYAPTTPFSLTIPQYHLDHVSSLPQRSSEPVHNHHQGVLDLLTQRIRDLESALENEHEADECIALLQAAVHEERTARDAAEDANATLEEKVAELEEEVFRLRQDLFALSGEHPVASTSTIPFAFASTVTSELPVCLVSDHAHLHPEAHIAELDSLRHFIELMVSLGGHKPVVDAAYQQITRGEPAEVALVAAIKDAVAQPQSVWRELLEPVTGERTQTEYLAQLQATLDARRQAQDWRRRAKWWKRKAREEGRHGETVTPSASAISAVVDVLPRERREKVEEMMVRLREGNLPRRVVRSATKQEEDIDIAVEEPTASALDAHEASSSSSTQSDLNAIAAGLTDLPSFPSEASLPAASSSMVLPTLHSSSTARISSAYNNLPPLASQTFRASYSIKSIPSRTSGRGLPVSTSTLTQTSVKSRRRRAKVIAVPSSASAALNPSAPPQTVDADVDIDISVEARVDVHEPNTAKLSPSSPAFSPLPKALVDFGRGSDDDLVLVLHNNFSDTSYRATPERCSASRSPTPSSESSNAVSTSEKKSRLPARMPGLRAIKRLSMSISMARGPAEATVTSAAPLSVAQGDNGSRGRSRKPSVAARSASPSHTAKMTMGKRLRFGMGGKTES